MSSFTFGIGVFPSEESESALKVVEAVRQAEEAGFDFAWIPDTQGIFRDLYVTMTLCARETSRIRIGTGVTNPITRHPAVTARAIGTLDEVWPGRILLGIGAGDTAFRHLGLSPLRPRECEEAVRCLRRLLAGEEGEFQGARVPRLLNYEGRRVPIYLAANGPKMLRTAGRVADGVLASVGASEELVRYAVEAVRAGAEGAGRDPGEVQIALHIGCDISENGDEARENVKTYVARRVIAPLPAHLTGFTEEERERFQRGYALRDHLQVGASHARMVPDAWVDRFSLAGTAAECLEKVRRFAKWGVQQLFILPTTRESAALIQIFRREIIPHFR